MNWIYVLAFCVTLITVSALVLTNRDYAAPAVITCVMFTLETFCVVKNVDYWDVRMSAKTCWIVIGGLALIVLLDVLCRILWNKREPFSVREYLNTRPIRISPLVWYAVLLFHIFASCYYIFSVMRVGGSYSLAAIGIVKKSTELNVDPIAKACYRLLRQTPYTFFYIFAYNTIVCKQNVKRSSFVLIPAFIAALGIFFSGSRAQFMVMLEATAIYFYIFMSYKNGWKRVRVEKYYNLIVIAVCLLLCFFVFSRGIVKGKSYEKPNYLEYFEYYLGSPLHLFNKVVENPAVAYPEHYDVFAERTFGAAWVDAYKRGLSDTKIIVISGIEGDGHFVPLGGASQGSGNVYTVFSAPYTDFGIVGMYVFVALLYSVFDVVYYKVIRGSQSIRKRQVYILLFGYCYNYIFMTFFKTTTSVIKLQTILEAVIMILFFLMVTSVKFCSGVTRNLEKTAIEESDR